MSEVAKFRQYLYEVRLAFLSPMFAWKKREDSPPQL
jgi:hypothetical protein